MPSRSNSHPSKRFTILAAEFHRPLAEALAQGAAGALRHAGVAREAIQVLWVPGAFELPVVAARVAGGRRRPAAIIAVGALIQGDTIQYEVLAHAVAQGLSEVAVRAQIPVTFGVVVARTLAQARARAGGRVGNRGAEAARAALAVLQIFKKLRTSP